MAKTYGKAASPDSCLVHAEGKTEWTHQGNGYENFGTKVKAPPGGFPEFVRVAAYGSFTDEMRESHIRKLTAIAAILANC
ncbi:hypothetical protein [Cupriavidus numazuensis]|uniref:Uncharacterized protein n=1 Tax=Cupriavidus numazuensis TaxID=221992 RepID=A0ABN7PYG5_9BURK|nr:hypothetical protein [Cupriavidus numazuensis]CAG2147626.1 hypothetical protein LMG26411_03171 [Cupriavidus numazuensis]